MKYLSLFSGIGGFEHGIEKSIHHDKLKCIGYSEIDQYAENIYQKHYPNHTRLGDATKIQAKDLPDFDFLFGGFPCQAFSNAGLRRGFDDTRGTLFFEIARILQEKKPRYFLLENVKGLLAHDKGNTFTTILRTLSELGYMVKWEMLNSKDFGVPQRRERVYIEGYSRAECGGEVLSARRKSQEDISKINRQLIVQNVKQQVTKRKYDVNVTELQKLLRHHKQKLKFSNKKIADKLGIPETQVAHWFRTDKHFSIPPAELWQQLKDILQITDNTHDKSITTFITKDGGYDMSNRAYHEDGLAPTITSSTSELIAVNKKAGQAQKVYDPDGLATTLCALGGGDGGKTGLYLVPDEREVKVVTNDSPSKHRGGNVFSSDGLIPTLTATDYKHPKKIIEKENKQDKPMLKLRETTSKGYLEAYEGDGVEIGRTNCTIRRGVAHSQSTGAVNTSNGWGTVTSDMRIRKLTPRECERLQGFPDDWTRWGADGEELSDTRRYIAIGNAVTTNVITFIINNWSGEI